jgi:hypothetical protein
MARKPAASVAEVDGWPVYYVRRDLRGRQTLRAGQQFPIQTKADVRF